MVDYSCQFRLIPTYNAQVKALLHYNLGQSVSHIYPRYGGNVFTSIYDLSFCRMSQYNAAAIIT